MRHLIFVMLLSFGWSNGQFFEDNSDEYDYSQSENVAEYQENNGYFAGKSKYFSGYEQENYLREDDDTPSNPGDVPIDGGWLLLPLAGIAIGVYYLRKRAKHCV